MNNYNIKNLPSSERPYEKFIKLGEKSLSDADLLAIILRTGSKSCNSIQLANNLLTGRHGNLLNIYDYSFEELQKIPGIGKVKAIQIKAIAELSKRIATTSRINDLVMNSPSSIASYYMEQMRHNKNENLVCVFFDSKCNFLGDKNLSSGSVNYSYVSPRDIFIEALQKEAVNFVLLHNHPSGDPTPSNDDIKVTKRVYSGAQLLGLNLIDHIIIGDNRYYSFLENELIT